MTEQSGVMLGSLLPYEFGRMEETMRREFDKDPNVRTAGFPNFAWRVCGTEATNALHDALNCDVFELVARGWCFARELMTYADDSEREPNKRTIVYLGEHSVTTSVHPVLIVTIGTIKCPPLRFTLDISAEFKSGALTIQNGYIKSAGCGACLVSAQLKYGEVKLHDKRKSRSVPVPGTINFAAPGLAIRSPK